MTAKPQRTLLEPWEIVHRCDVYAADQARIAELEAFIRSVIDDPRSTVSQIRDASAALAAATKGE